MPNINNINQTTNVVQTKIIDQLNTESPNTLRGSGKFSARIADLVTSKSGIEKKNSQIAAKLLSTLTSQVGQTIANRTVDKLLNQRDVKTITNSDIKKAIHSAAEDYAKALDAFTESPLTKEFLPGGTKAPANLSASGKESYTSTFISHCLAQSFDLGITPNEMIALLGKGPAAGHPEHYQSLETLSKERLQSISDYAANIGDKKFHPNPVTISYKELGQRCLEGLSWYGKPEAEALELFKKGKQGGKAETLQFGDMKVLRMSDPSFITIRNVAMDDKIRAKGFDANSEAGPLTNNKIHLSVAPEDMAKAFQVIFPYLTSPEMPFDEMKLTNFECHKPGKEAHMAENRRLMVEGETPEIRAHAADQVRMGNRVHVGNQLTFYCPTFTNPDTRKANIQDQKDFVKLLEQELHRAGVKPGDKSEGHELPGLDFTTFRWEENPRVPSNQLDNSHLEKVRNSDVYQAFLK